MAEHSFAHRLVFGAVLASVACGVPKQYVADRDHLNTAIAAFGQASAEVAQAGAGTSGTTMMTPALSDSLIAIIGRGLASADSVGDPFLAWLHPQLPRQFRDHLVAGERLLLEGIRAEDSGRVTQAEQLLVQWEQFWNLHRADLAAKANP
jgi:hypothetical protein